MTESPHSDSSVEIISSVPCCATETSEDEVAWGVSDEDSSESSVTDSDADYVLLPHILAEGLDHDSGEGASETTLPVLFDLLSVTKVDSPQAKQTNGDTISGDMCSSSTSTGSSCSHQLSNGARTPNDSYIDAVAYITQYLDAPVKKKDSISKLRLLQALVIEFGVSEQSPTSIKSATTLLKSSVHVNINDYVAKRGKDQGELQRIMQPSKKALRKDIRRSGRRSSLKWVKEHGLNVLLIGFSN